MSKVRKPLRGEVWDVNFDPSRGAEIGKRRPAVVVSEDAIGRLPLRIVVPITDWKDNYSAYAWFVHLPPSKAKGQWAIEGIRCGRVSGKVRFGEAVCQETRSSET